MFVVVALITAVSWWAVVCMILSTVAAGDWGTVASLGAGVPFHFSKCLTLN